MWKKFFELSVASYMQRISLTGTLPPFIMNAFMVKTISGKSTKTIRATTNRPEVGLIVVEVNRRTSMMRNARAIVMALEEELADRDRILVFFQSAAECERFSRDYGSAQYHSKLPSFGSENKQGNLDRWDSGETKVLAATTAAALGVDRPYVKFVLVVESTYGLLTFAQEIGRGGRRGQHSYGILLRDPYIIHVPSKKNFKGTRDKTDVGAEMAFHVYAANAITCRRLILLDTMDGPAMCNRRRKKTRCEDLPGCNYCDVCSPTGRIATMAKESVERAHLVDFANVAASTSAIPAAAGITTAASVARIQGVHVRPTAPRPNADSSAPSRKPAGRVVAPPPVAGPSNARVAAQPMPRPSVPLRKPHPPVAGPSNARVPAQPIARPSAPLHKQAARVVAPQPVAGPSRSVHTPSQESEYFDEPTPSMLAEFDAIDGMHTKRKVSARSRT